MLEKLSKWTGLLMLFLSAGLLFFSPATLHARGQSNLHILFTGGVTGRLEPSG